MKRPPKNIRWTEDLTPSEFQDGLRKAAVLLASLPTQDAAYLLRQLDESQLISIAKAASRAPMRER